ncbi:MAG: hypothetical protein LAT68_00965 [Cyclobacteriaceae bacterium]|nr:hypothetical protein [Cyclobacteriaceae bacterium]MCH8514873.1 hypothetical protein [Cyclobacteriaceae bacterium]
MNKILLFIAMLCIGNGYLFAQYSGGSGGSNNPFQIGSLNDLVEMHTRISAGEHLNSHFILSGDIDATLTANVNSSQYNFTPIGLGSPHVFRGVFNGNGRTIYNLFINRPSTDHVGLFSKLGQGAVIRNLQFGYIELINNTIYPNGVARITGRNQVGLVAGSASGRNILIENINVQSDGIEVSGNMDIGGIIGRLEGERLFGDVTTITLNKIFSAARVNSTIGGGIIGKGDRFTLDQSFTTSDISGNSTSGGLVGATQGSTTFSASFGPYSGITNSFSLANVSGSQLVGGIVGLNSQNHKLKIENLYFDGELVNSNSPNPSTAPILARNIGIWGNGPNVFYRSTLVNDSNIGQALSFSEMTTTMMNGIPAFTRDVQLNCALPYLVEVPVVPLSVPERLTYSFNPLSSPIFLNVTPSAGYIELYDAPSGGNLIGTGNTITFNKDDYEIVYLSNVIPGVCQNTQRFEIPVELFTAIPIVETLDVSICDGENTLFIVPNSDPDFFYRLNVNGNFLVSRLGNGDDLYLPYIFDDSQQPLDIKVYKELQANSAEYVFSEPINLQLSTNGVSSNPVFKDGQMPSALCASDFQMLHDLNTLIDGENIRWFEDSDRTNLVEGNVPITAGSTYYAANRESNKCLSIDNLVSPFLV